MQAKEKGGQMLLSAGYVVLGGLLIWRPDGSAKVIGWAIGIAALLSIVSIAQLGFFLPAAATLCYGFLTIRMDDATVMDFLRYAVRYFISMQQYYEWR